MLRLLLIVVLFACVEVRGNPTNLDFDGRIVGGEPIYISEAPYQILLRKFDFPICGGAILTSSYVVTAAHCTDGVQVNSLSIQYGATSIYDVGVIVKVETIHQCPGYFSSYLGNDISVLKLTEDIIFGKNAKPISIATEEPPAGTPLFVTGWGALSEGGSSSSVLQGVIVNYITRAACNGAYRPQYYITESMICAGLLNEGTRDACQGDSGGPLVVKEQGVRKLLGIVSWGIGCARPDYPGVYANVPYFKAFIDGILLS